MRAVLRLRFCFFFLGVITDCGILGWWRSHVNAASLLREVHAAEEGLEAGVELSGCVETTDGLVFVGVHLKNRQEAMHRQNIVN